MRKGFPAILFGIVLLFVACQKEISSDVVAPPGGNGNAGTGTEIKRIQQGIDPNLTRDTIWLITYTATKKINKVIDSLYHDTATARYDASDRLIQINGTSGDYSGFTYDAAGLLTQIDYYWAGSKERYLIEYSGGNVSKTTYLSDLGSGRAYQSLAYETYTVTDGNITEVKQFTMGGTLDGQATLTYGTQANPFKNLSLFNYGNQLGMDQIVNFYTYFNKNISTGIKVGPITFKTNNTFTGQKVTKITSESFYGTGGSFTWMFSY